MKRFTVCLLLILGLLGCSASDATTISCKDLTVTLPNVYMDLSDEAYAKDTDFLYGRERLIVLGLGEKKTDLNVFNLEAYTALVLKDNSLACTLETVENGYRFTYKAPVVDTEYVYVTGTYEGREHFWVIQCYCPAEYLDTYQQEIDTILDSVRMKI